MKKNVSFRIYPNKIQKEQIHQTLGCCRLVYNIGLDMREQGFKNNERVHYEDTCKKITELKNTENYSFLKNADAVALQQSLRDLDRAYQNYFTKGKKVPKFKSKHDNRQTYRTMRATNRNNICFCGKHIKLPKLGYVKVKQTMEISHINHVTVKKTPTGKYFAVLNVDFKPEFKQNNGKQIGIDVGLKEFYTDSDGNKIENPKYYEKSEKKLIREQCRLSRKQKRSKNWDKQRIRVAKIQEKIVNQRNDFLQKESTKLVRENQTICIEDLNVKGLLRNHKLAKAISSVSWYKFFTMLEYKAIWYGNTIIKVPRFYSSSQICNCCGYKNTRTKNFKIRVWECPQCHTRHDRDYNAAINILNKGLSLA